MMRMTVVAPALSGEVRGRRYILQIFAFYKPGNRLATCPAARKSSLPSVGGCNSCFWYQMNNNVIRILLLVRGLDNSAVWASSQNRIVMSLSTPAAGNTSSKTRSPNKCIRHQTTVKGTNATISLSDNSVEMTFSTAVSCSQGQGQTCAKMKITDYIGFW